MGRVRSDHHALRVVGLVHAGIRLYNDVSTGPVSSSARPSILPGMALLIALGFETCSGFHVSTTYVIKNALSDSQIAALVQTSDATAAVVSAKAGGPAVTGDPPSSTSLRGTNSTCRRCPLSPP